MQSPAIFDKNPNPSRVERQELLRIIHSNGDEHYKLPQLRTWFTYQRSKVNKQQKSSKGMVWLHAPTASMLNRPTALSSHTTTPDLPKLVWETALDALLGNHLEDYPDEGVPDRLIHRWSKISKAPSEYEVIHYLQDAHGITAVPDPSPSYQGPPTPVSTVGRDTPTSPTTPHQAALPSTQPAPAQPEWPLSTAIADEGPNARATSAIPHITQPPPSQNVAQPPATDAAQPSPTNLMGTARRVPPTRNADVRPPAARGLPPFADFVRDAYADAVGRGAFASLAEFDAALAAVQARAASLGYAAPAPASSRV